VSRVKVFLCFFKENGKVIEQEIMYGSCGCPIRPMLGEAVYHENERYIVVDVSWDFVEKTCYISAIYQEVEDADAEEVY